MKKRKILTEVFILFFVAALFIAVYVMIEMGSDWLAVLGGAAVLLIATYLLVDHWFDTSDTKEVPSEKVDLLENLEKMSEIQKAIYTVIKRGNNDNANLFRGLEMQMSELTETLKTWTTSLPHENPTDNTAQEELIRTGQSVLDAVRGLRQDQQLGVKNLIKFEKENARQIAENAHTNTEMTIIELHSMMDEVIKLLQAQRDQLSYLRVSALSAPLSESEMNASGVDFDRMVDETEMMNFMEENRRTHDISDELYDILSTEDDIMPEAVKDTLTEEDQVAMDELELDTAIVEPEEEHNTQGKSEEEIQNTLQSMSSEDPNRALTPDEIAAMFAAIQS